MFYHAWDVLPFGYRRAPNCILVEVYRCFGFDASESTREDLIANLEQCRINQEDLGDLANFCNPDFEGTWSSGRLVRKVSKMLRFFSNPSLPSNFTPGYPTPQISGVYTPLQIFCYSQEIGIIFEETTTLNRIYQIVRYSFSFTTEPQGFQVNQALEEAKSLTLVEKALLGIPNHFTSYLLERFYFYNKKYEIDYLSFLELSNQTSPTQAFEKLKPHLNDHFIDEVIIPGIPGDKYPADFLETFGEDWSSEALMNHFYLGKNFSCISNTETPILMEDVETLKEAISYGVPGQKLTVFSVEEVYQTIKRKRVFFTPDCRRLRDQAVDRLIKISDEIPRLQRLCQEVKKERLTGGEVTQLLNKVNPENKEAIVHSFWLVFNSGMYMRGWDGQSSYPLTQGSPLPETHYFVSVSLIKCLEQSHPLVLDSPILRYEDRDWVYEIENGQKQTIKSRIDLLIGKPDQVSACMRVASNWFVGTAYRYLSALSDSALPFKIQDVSYFS